MEIREWEEMEGEDGRVGRGLVAIMRGCGPVVRKGSS
jgi:hypothetical protein